MRRPDGTNCSNSNRPLEGYEEKHPSVSIPQMAVAPLKVTLKSPRVGTVAPLICPQTTGGGPEALLPSSPAFKGNPFWAVVPPITPPVASRPGSLSYPGDSSGGGDSLGKAGVAPSHHRHSTHSKDIDRMSTCSSTSEQSIQSTQSNGVRPQSGGPFCGATAHLSLTPPLPHPTRAPVTSPPIVRMAFTRGDHPPLTERTNSTG